MYGFAGGDPVNFDDPFGLCKGTKGEDLPPEQCKKNLTSAQDAAMSNPKYQPVAGGSTFCNQATLSVILAMNGSTGGLVDANGRALRANDMVAGLKANRNFRAVSADQATALANQGELVVAAGPGHVSTIRPEPSGPGAESYRGRGPLHADVGRNVGIYRFNYAWGADKRAQVVFFTSAP